MQDDFEGGHVGFTLKRVVLVAIAGALVAGAAIALVVPEPGSRLVIIGAVLAAATLAYGLAHRGHPGTAAAVFLATVWGAATFGATLPGSGDAPTSSALLFTVVAAGLLLGERAAIGAAVISLLTLAGLHLARSAGRIEGLQGVYASPSALWIQAAVLAATAALVVLGVSRLRAALTAAQRNAEHLRTLFDRAPLGVMTLDADLTILSANAAWGELVGAPSSAVLIGLRLRSLPVWSGELAEGIERCLEGERETIEVSWTTRFGKTVDARIHGGPIRDSKGRIVGVQAIAEDVTEHRKAESRQHSLELQLRQAQKMEAVGRMAGGVAHDFNNLLTVINGYADGLCSDLATQPELAESAREIQLAGDRAAALTRQLLLFSRMQPQQSEVIDLNETVAALGGMLERVLGPTVQLVVRPPRCSADVEIDRNLMEQVLVNLAVNARDAMPEGGQLCIETSEERIGTKEAEALDGITAGRWVVVAVADTGCGMSEELRSRIFEPFFTTKEPGEGTGLGLSTSYGIVRQNGGVIRVHSDPGHGSRFEILLPGAESRSARIDASPPAAAPQPVGGESLLLVEDDRAIRRLLFASLESAGYRVLAAQDGEEALKWIRFDAVPVDVLVTDVVMPGMGVGELVRQVVALRPDVQTILISGYPQRPGDESSLPAHRLFLQKPFPPSELLSQLRTVLGSDPVRTEA